MATTEVEVVEIDHHDAIRSLREVVKGNEGFVYKSPDPKVPELCHYEWNGKPSCLVGKALRRLAPNVKFLRNGPIDEINLWPDEDPVMEGVKLSGPAIWVFEAAQVVQDRRQPWGLALEKAEEKYREACEIQKGSKE